MNLSSIILRKANGIVLDRTEAMFDNPGINYHFEKDLEMDDIAG